MSHVEESLSQRILFAAIAAVFGFIAYAMAEYLPDMVENTRLLLFLFTFFYGLFAAILAMLGVVEKHRLILPAFLLSVAGATLMQIGSLQFDDAETYLDNPLNWTAYLVFMTLPVPFLIARFGRGAALLDYPALFDAAWSLVVRGVLAGLFVLASAAVLWLSAYLLSFVGIEILKELLGEAFFAVPLFAGIFGLALAVVLEMQNVISVLRSLKLRLLRLLLPLVVVVSAVFLVAVPFQGLDTVFGFGSAGATILAMALAGVTFMTATLDSTDEEAAQSAVLLWSARAMALLLPFLCGLVIYSIYLRVDQYGLTPDRIAAMLGTLVAGLYALGYAGNVLFQRLNWKAGLRRTNVLIALAMIAISALWLTPLLPAERMSANNQVARFLKGKSDHLQVGLWEMKHEWGRAGRRALDRLVASPVAKENPEMSARLANLETAEGKHAFNRDNRSEQVARKIDQINQVIAKIPANASFPVDAVGPYYAERLSQGCALTLENGAPGCVLIEDDWHQRSEGNEYFVLYRENDGRLGSIILARDKWNEWRLLSGRYLVDPGGFMLQRIIDGEYERVPTGEHTLTLDSKDIIFDKF